MLRLKELLAADEAFNKYDDNVPEARAEIVRGLLKAYEDVSLRAQHWDYRETCLNVEVTAYREILECLEEHLWADTLYPSQGSDDG